MTQGPVLILGRDGQVGGALLRSAPDRWRVVALGRAGLDLSEPAAITRTLSEIRPQAVLNAAAWTDVDGAEREPAAARAINATAPEVIADWCRRNGATLLHYGTDYVFNGRKAGPYVEEDDTDPLGVYGLTKRDGELAALEHGATVLRVSWVHGDPRRGFIPAIARAFLTPGSRLLVRGDQRGAMTAASMIAAASWLALEQLLDGRARPGLYHLTAAGCATRYEVARLIRAVLAIRGADPVGELGEPDSGDEPDGPGRARRPVNCRLDCDKFCRAFGFRPDPWDLGVVRSVDAWLAARGNRIREAQP